MLSYLLVLWCGPAVLLSVWTLITALLCWTLPLHTRLPRWASANVLSFMHNPKDEYLYQRPSGKTVLAILGLGVVPGLNLLMLAFQGWLLGAYVYYAMRPERPAM